MLSSLLSALRLKTKATSKQTNKQKKRFQKMSNSIKLTCRTFMKCIFGSQFLFVKFLGIKNICISQVKQVRNKNLNVSRIIPRSRKEVQFSSVAQSCPTLLPHELQHARPPCLSPTPRVHSDSRPSSQ